jgi:hypothetical protein
MPATFTFESQYRRPSLNANPDANIFPGGGTADINAPYVTTVLGQLGGSTFTLIPSSGQQNLQNLRVGMFITGAGIAPNTTLTAYNSTATPPFWSTSTANTVSTTITVTASLRPWNGNLGTTTTDIVNYFGTSSIAHPTIGLLGRINQLGTSTVTGSQILTFQVWNNGKTRIGNSNITSYTFQQNLPPDLMLDVRGSIATSGSTYTSASAQGFTDNTAMYFGSPGTAGSWRTILSGSGATSRLNLEYSNGTVYTPLTSATPSQLQLTGSLRVTGSLVLSGSFDVYNNNDTFFTPKIIHDRLTTVGAPNPYMSFTLIDGLGVSGSALEFQALSKGTTVNPYFAGGVNIAAYPQSSTAVTTTSGRPIKFLNSILGTSDTGSFEWHYNTTLTITGSTLRAKLDVPSGNFMTSGSINIASDSTYSTAETHDALYFGTPGVVGSWRISMSGSGATSTLVIEKWPNGGTAYSKSATFI